METSTEVAPLVVVQTDSHGCDVIVGLAFRKDSPQKNDAGLSKKCIYYRYSGRPTISYPPRVLRDSERFAIGNLDLVFPKRMLDVYQLVHFLFQDEAPRVQMYAAQTVADLSTIDQNRPKIARSYYAMMGLTRLLFMGDPSSQCYAAVALGNVAANGHSAQSFTEYPDTFTGLVRLLYEHGNGLVQNGAAMALANLSCWPDGTTMVLDTPGSVAGLAYLAVTGPRFGHFGRDEARRALANLALSRHNSRILEVPRALKVLAESLSVESTGHDLSACDPIMQEMACRALASLSYTTENAQTISESEEFPLVLQNLVRVLARRPMTWTGAPTNLGGRTTSRHRTSGIAVRKLAAMALANLSITEKIQLTVADFPDALAGLFTALELKDAGSSSSLQLQECAAMALGNLALAKDNRRKIMEFGSDGLAGLAGVLFQDKNPAGEEYAAWALANLSHDRACDSGDTRNSLAVKVAQAPDVLRGLARLLTVRMPTERRHQLSSSRVRVQEQAARALANLSYPHENQVTIARVPNVVKALAALLSRHRHDRQNSNRMIQQHAARALANLTCAKANRKSPQIFSDAIPGLVDLLWLENADVCPKTRECGAIAVGNFALVPAHHWRIVSSRHAMTGLVRMLSRCENACTCVGKEQAAWALANLAHGNCYTKIVIATFPLAESRLRELLVSEHESPRVQEQARRALEGLSDIL